MDHGAAAREGQKLSREPPLRSAQREEWKLSALSVCVRGNSEHPGAAEDP